MCFESLQHQALEANWSQRACYNAELDMAVYIENFNPILRGGQRGSFLRFLEGNRKVNRYIFHDSHQPEAREHRLVDENWDWNGEWEEEWEEEEGSDNSGTSMAALPSGNTFIPRGRFRAPALELGY